MPPSNIHGNINRTLSSFQHIYEEINYLKTHLSLKKEDYNQRKEVCESIRKIVKELNPDYEVQLFGSSVNGVGFRFWSDLDAYVELPNAQCKFSFKKLNS